MYKPNQILLTLNIIFLFASLFMVLLYGIHLGANSKPAIESGDCVLVHDKTQIADTVQVTTYLYKKENSHFFLTEGEVWGKPEDTIVIRSCYLSIVPN